MHTRPFRTPHHTTSLISMIGGGINPKPGEVSLAHYGVLYLDELPEFNRNTIEALRGPLEDKQVTISRINSNLTYPCNFMLVASMNPCPCGFFGSKVKECSCTPQSIERYLSKISGPLLDRIDICIEAEQIEYSKFDTKENVESSSEIRKRVNNARKIQINRYKNEKIIQNSELSQKLIEEHCKLDEKGKAILQKSYETLNLSARGYSKILKVARTIADLDEKESIEPKHLLEAIQYRSIDRKYWKR